MTMVKLAWACRSACSSPIAPRNSLSTRRMIKMEIVLVRIEVNGRVACRCLDNGTRQAPPLAMVSSSPVGSMNLSGTSQPKIAMSPCASLSRFSGACPNQYNTSPGPCNNPKTNNNSVIVRSLKLMVLHHGPSWIESS